MLDVFSEDTLMQRHNSKPTKNYNHFIQPLSYNLQIDIRSLATPTLCMANSYFSIVFDRLFIHILGEGLFCTGCQGKHADEINIGYSLV